jgi:hypothetical protein
MSQTLNRPYSEIVGISGLPGYALDSAVVRWGTAFKAALEDAGSEAKTPAEAERRAQQVIRRFIPSTRQYR